ncbi:MAG TPA: hypothetical protein VIQ03_03375 [Gammaproteobacteria bacterium]
MTLPFKIFGECLNEINNEKDLLLSNICNYGNTILAKLDNISLSNKYSPFTYFKPHRIYTIEATVKENIKGSNSGKLCFIQWREEPFDLVYEMENNMFIISFNKTEKCSTLEVGSIINFSEQLLQIARESHVK